MTIAPKPADLSPELSSLLVELFEPSPESIIPSRSFGEAQQHWEVDLSEYLRGGVRDWFRTCNDAAPEAPLLSKFRVEEHRAQQNRHTKIAGAARQLIELLQQELDRGGSMATSLAFKVVTVGALKLSLPDLIGELTAIEAGARNERPFAELPGSSTYFAEVEALLLKRPPEYARDRRGINKQIRGCTVLLLWFICLNAGGDPSAYWDHDGNDDRGSHVTPFVKGAHCLMRHLPRAIAAQPNKSPGEIISPETIGDIARDYMRQLKKVRGVTR